MTKTLPEKVVQIGDEEFVLVAFPATKGAILQKKIAKIILPVASAYFSGEEQENVLPKILDKVWENLDNIDIELIKKLVEEGAYKGKGRISIDFDTEFAAEYDKLIDLLQAIIMFNFKSLFTKIGFAVD